MCRSDPFFGLLAHFRKLLTYVMIENIMRFGYLLGRCDCDLQMSWSWLGLEILSSKYDCARCPLARKSPPIQKDDSDNNVVLIKMECD